MTTLRIAYNPLPYEKDTVDLAVTPQALVFLSRQRERKYVKPIDFFTPEDVKSIKQWVAETIGSMAEEWREKSNILPLFLETVGADLCILLEYLKIADLVLGRIWEEKYFSQIYINLNPHENINSMIQYCWANFGYHDLLLNGKWRKQKSINVRQNKFPNHEDIIPVSDPTKTSFLKKNLFMLKGLYDCAKEIKLLTLVGMKTGFSPPMIPNLLIVPTRNVDVMLRLSSSINLYDYLTLLPKNRRTAKKIQSELISSIENWFELNSPVMDNLGFYKEIIKKRLMNFVKLRLDLVIAYVQMKELKNTKSIKILLGSTLGCAKDAWCAMGVQENGGIIASGQHGGGYGNAYFPYFQFSDLRYNYFFSYGPPDETPLQENGGGFAKAELIKAGSPVLYKINQSCGPRPTKVSKILYVMNLCVPFYSMNFPWENILEQFRVLDLLNSFSKDYIIEVKEDQSNTVKHDLYPGLIFKKEPLINILHNYDFLIMESCVSTAVLEAASTNKFLAIYTGAEWEDATKESLVMLSKRAECFNDWEKFLAGLEKILQDPEKYLDFSKLDSNEFLEIFLNPVSTDRYVGIIKENLFR